MNTFFAQLDFFTTDSGLLLAAGLVALAIVLWEWRLALLSLLVVQVSVAALTVNRYGVASEWGGVQIVVVALCCVILAISAAQRPGGHRLYLAGSIFLRATALVLILLAGYLFEFNATLPLLDARTTGFFTWLAVSALLMLALGDSALFSAVALLQWSIVAQAVTSVLLRLPGLVSVIGVLELLIALACSYLVLTESIARARPTVVATDVDPRSRIQLASQVQRAAAARRTGEFEAIPMGGQALGGPTSNGETPSGGSAAGELTNEQTTARAQPVQTR